MAKEIVTTRKIARFDMNRGLTELEDVVVSEQALTIHVNGSELVTLLCTPEHLGDLAIGYLAGEGFIKDPNDIMELKVNQETGECMVLLKGSHSITERTSQTVCDDTAKAFLLSTRRCTSEQRAARVTGYNRL